jgi:RNA polymerase sigma factor (sigma-70 family)
MACSMGVTMTTPIGWPRGPGEQSDAELLQGSVADPELFGSFYDRHVSALLSFFYRRTASAQLAADLTAETFAEAFLSRGRYRNTGAPARAWLLGIARHELSRSIRRQQAESRARRRLGMTRTVVEDTDLERIEELADFRPLRTAIQDAVKRLPPALSCAVILRVANDLPYPEVARQLGCSEKAARVRVSRALTRLEEFLGDL